MQRRKFGREFKIEAVRLVRERGVSVAQAARDLNVHLTMLHRWVKQAAADPQHAFPGQGQMKPEQIEIDRLRKEVARLKAKRDILKKSRRILCEGRDMKFAFIAKHRAVWPVAWMCAALGVSRSGFHAWLTRQPSQRAGRRSHPEQGARELCCQRPHLRRKARLARCARRGHLVRAAPHRADHA